MSFWKKILVVLPAFVALHLVATGAALLIDDLRDLWDAGVFGEVYLLSGYAAGYALGAAIGVASVPGTARAMLSLSLTLSIVALYGFVRLAGSDVQAVLALLAAGLAAGMALPVAARAFGLSRNFVGGVLMAVLAGGCWWLSVPFVDHFRHGAPVGGIPDWAAPYYVQGALCLLWLAPVLLFGSERPSARRR